MGIKTSSRTSTAAQLRLVKLLAAPEDNPLLLVVMISRSSELAHTAAIFASEVAGDATALLLRVVELDVGRSTDEVKRLVA